ncbi:hypothetical protein D9758_014345 [Tetrapyrgos nigripes]|uniref:Uncharacterized protein n=1 Tax=Tetrapyrgos nigripes TaxID=182062 RepID=A0A8H5FGS7_9AGAR|nr:hypothetical protein D9758_014345 [Tetrapyrgos nigripes]
MADVLPLASLSSSKKRKYKGLENTRLLPGFTKYHVLEYYMGLEEFELPLECADNTVLLRPDMKLLLEQLKWALIPALETLEVLVAFQLENEHKPLHRRQIYTEIVPSQEYEYAFVPLHMDCAPLYIHHPNGTSTRYDWPYTNLPHFKLPTHPIYACAFLFHAMLCMMSKLQTSMRLASSIQKVLSLRHIWLKKVPSIFREEEAWGQHRHVFLDGREPTFFQDFPCCNEIKGFTMEEVDLYQDIEDNYSDIYTSDSRITKTGSLLPPSPIRFPSRYALWKEGISQWAIDVLDSQDPEDAPPTSDFTDPQFDSDDGGVELCSCSDCLNEPVRSFDDALQTCDENVVSSVTYTIRLRDHWKYTSNEWAFLATGFPLLTAPIAPPSFWGELPFVEGLP